jgi:hypothetical protein
MLIDLGNPTASSVADPERRMGQEMDPRGVLAAIVNPRRVGDFDYTLKHLVGR